MVRLEPAMLNERDRGEGGGEKHPMIFWVPRSEVSTKKYRADEKSPGV